MLGGVAAGGLDGVGQRGARRDAAGPVGEVGAREGVSGARDLPEGGHGGRDDGRAGAAVQDDVGGAGAVGDDDFRAGPGSGALGEEQVFLGVDEDGRGVVEPGSGGRDEVRGAGEVEVQAEGVVAGGQRAENGGEVEGRRPLMWKTA